MEFIKHRKQLTPLGRIDEHDLIVVAAMVNVYLDSESEYVPERLSRGWAIRQKGDLVVKACTPWEALAFLAGVYEGIRRATGGDKTKVTG